ncbi:Rrf2 family transcriptional regulator [beta proteobacterium AAP51]|nr:Rrf2 family transcriptional regulator [beta proteobacterium AAP51]
MRLSEYTDYTLRVLMYCAAHRDRLVTIGELAEQHGLSKNHLMKVVNDLARQGLLETTRGRGGGLRLLAEPETIRIGDVVRATETDFRLVECFDASTDACTLTPNCRLKHLFAEALTGYFKVLDGATLADMTQGLSLPAVQVSPSPAGRKLPAVVAAVVATQVAAKAAAPTPRRTVRAGRSR